MNKNFFIFILISIFIFQTTVPFYFSFAQLSVPVSDSGVANLLQGVIAYLEKVTKTLDENLALLGDQLTQLNTRISKILELQTKRDVEQIFSDLQKDILFKTYLDEIRKMSEERDIKNSNNYEKYLETLEEAKSAGAYLAIKDFPKIVSCLPSETKSGIIAYVASIASQYQMSSSASKILSSEIPDCEEGSSESSFPQNNPFYVKLFQPFNLGSLLAQFLNQDQNPEVFSFSVTSAFDETISSIQASHIKDLLASHINSKANELEQKRKEEIGNIWPIEKCVEWNNYLPGDGGKAVCVKYQTLINVENLTKGLETKFNNPQESTFGSSFIYQNLFSLENIISTLGLATSPSPVLDFGVDVTLPSFISTSTLEEIYKSCDFATTTGASDSSTTTKQVLEQIYLQCIKDIETKYEAVLKALNEVMLERIEMSEKLEKRAEEQKRELENLFSQMEGCPKAQEELGKIAHDLDIKIQTSFTVRTRVEPKLEEIERFANEVISILQKIQNVLQNIGFNFDASIVLDLGFMKKTVDISGIVGIIGNIPYIGEIINAINGLIGKIKDLLGKQIFGDILKELFNQRGINIDSILKDLNEANSNLNEAERDLAKLYVDLQKDGFAISSILNFSYLLDENQEKIDIYKNFLDAGYCGEGSRSNPLQSKNKTETKVVYRIEDQKERISPLEKLLNLFSAKLVEINFNQ